MSFSTPELLLNALTAHADEAIISIDAKAEIIFNNPQTEKLFGYNAGELIGSKISRLFSDKPTSDDLMMLDPSKEISAKYKSEWKSKEGSTVFLSINAGSLKGPDFNINGLCIIARDISEAIKSRKAIEQKAKYADEMLEGTNDGFIRLDKNYCYLYLNKKVSRMIGMDSASLIGKCVWDVFPQAVDSPTFKIFRQAFNEQTYLFNVDYYKPLDLWQENHVYPSADGLSIFIRDISERKRAEEKIRRSEEIYRIIASSIPGSLICLFDPQYRYTFIEGDMLGRLGYIKEELLGKSVNDVLSPERLAAILPDLYRVFNGETFTTKDTRRGFDTLTRFVPFRNDDNEVISAMLVVIDISEIQDAHRQIIQLNSELELKVVERTKQYEEALKELDSFSYSVAHDLRTPLRAIAGYATMLLEDYGPQLDAECQRLLTNVDRNANRMGTLIDELLTFSRLGRKPLQKSEVNMNELFDSAISELTGDSSTIDIHKANLPNAFADQPLIRHVILNLVSNAIKYSSKESKPRIEISSSREGQDVIYSIKDNGVGFDMAYAAKLFGVFQRLHSNQEFEGTGVGLAIVQRIVQRHGGRVWANGVRGEGATFSFTLPVAAGNR